ncbi:MAG TPA: RES family NAD+ phosphorylase [Polyangiaceae bacterium]|jgi:hypothetical protein|nr:RES family NAD+ phosphorylase [Polyangiaceae bacterium]
MPKASPPTVCPGVPVLREIPAGTQLWRVHSARFGAAAFNPTAASDPFRGGRFDSRDGSYAYLYAAESKEAAVAEVLVRDIPVDGRDRFLPLVALEGRCLSRVEVTAALRVVSLCAPEWGHVGQDAWLTKCDSAEYALTRAWADAIRAWVPEAAGFVWRSKRDENWLVYIFFSDRLPSLGVIVKRGRCQRIDRGRGRSVVREILARHNVELGP